jgi:hypothetical protein
VERLVLVILSATAQQMDVVPVLIINADCQGCADLLAVAMPNAMAQRMVVLPVMVTSVDYTHRYVILLVRVTLSALELQVGVFTALSVFVGLKELLLLQTATVIIPPCTMLPMESPM